MEVMYAPLPAGYDSLYSPLFRQDPKIAKFPQVVYVSYVQFPPSLCSCCFKCAQRKPLCSYNSSPGRWSVLPQTRPHIRPTPLLELLGVFPPHPGGLHVGGALVVGTAQHADDTEQDGFGGLDGRPPFRGVLVAVRVVFGAVEDGDADFAGGVDFCPHSKENPIISFRVFISGESKIGGFPPRPLSPPNEQKAISPFGWKTGVLNVILGGKSGYSTGKIRWAR